MSTDHLQVSAMGDTPPLGLLSALDGQVIKSIFPWDDRGELTTFYHDDYRLIDVQPDTTIWLSLEANFNGWLEVFDAATGQLVAWDDDSGRETNALLGVLPLRGVTYRVRAGSHGGIGSGYFTLKTLSLADAATEWAAAAREPSTGPSLMPFVNVPLVSTPITTSVVITQAPPVERVSIREIIALPSGLWSLDTEGNTLLWRNEEGQAFVEVAGQRLPVSSPWNSGAGDASSTWRMLAAETLDGVNTLLWYYTPANALHLWTLDANWHWQASSGLIPLGTAEAWDLEERFQIDADDDRRIGAPFATLDISGNTVLLRRGDGQAFVEVAGQRQRVASPWNSGAGDASSDWRMLAAETLNGVNTILWRHSPSNALHLWTLDANWHWQASGGLIPLGTAEAWDLEERFLVDADGDQRIGAPFATLDMSGNTVLLRRGDGQAFVEVAGQRQPVVSPWNSGAGDASSDWRMLAAETLNGVNTILWRHSPSNALHLWTLDANWHWHASGGLIPLGTAEAWNLEQAFQFDADGDGRLGTPPPVVTLTVSRGTVAEDGNEALIYTFTRSGSTGGALSVNILVGGTATPFSDYSGISATGEIGAVTFAPGSATATLRILPTADAVPEANETIALTLAPGDGYIVGTGTAVNGNILDDDSRISLYSYTASGGVPSAQGWLAFGTGFVGRQSLTTSGTLLDSTPLVTDIAGYSNHRANDAVLVNNAFPELDRSEGFSLDLQLRLDIETHFSDDRAGFTILLLDQGPSPVGIELGFWTTRIFSQAGGNPPFSAIADQAIGLNTAVMTPYSLRILDDHYMLLANNRLLLQGQLQDYSQASVPAIFPYNPYTTPNMLFLGDNTSRASARVTLGEVSLTRPLSGGVGRDTMTGTAGADQLNGAAGDDLINGEDGDDWLIGGPGADALAGSSGNDILNGGAGGDLLSGGPGQDVFACPSFSDSPLATPDVITDYTPDDVLDRAGPGTTLTSSLGHVSQLDASLVADLLTATAFPANSTRAFTVNGITGTVVAFDSGTAGFDAATDALVILEGYTISASHPVTVI